MTCHILSHLLNHKFAVSINILVFKNRALQVGSGLSYFLLDQFLQIMLYVIQLNQLCIKSICMQWHCTINTLLKLNLLLFRRIFDHTICFELLQKNFIGFLCNCFVKFTYNLLIPLIFLGKVYDSLLEFGNLRYDFWIQVFHIFVLCKTLELTPKALTILVC